MADALRFSIHSVSDKFLEDVFRYLLDESPIHLPFEREDPRHTLPLVSKRWANTAWSLCSLWNDMLFTGRPDPLFHHGPIPLLRQFSLCVRRSCNSPLSISFQMIYDGWFFNIVDLIIIPHAPRIRKLASPVYGDDIILKFLTIPAGQFSLLESLELWFINTLEHPESSFPPRASFQFSAFRIAPKLRKVTAHILNGMCPIDLNLPSSQLTTLELGVSALSPQELLQLFRSTTLLESAFLCVHFSKPRSRKQALSSSSVRVRKLRTLRLRLLSPNADKRLFSLLRFPSLENVWIEIHGDFQYWYMPNYTRLLGASKNSIQYVRLSDFNDKLSETEAGNADDTIQRRYRDSRPDALEMFFEVIYNASSLFLPVGLQLHEETVDKIASCALLPFLHEIEIGALNAWPILDMIRYRRSRVIGALDSFPDRQITYPRFIYLMIPLQGLTVAAENELAEEMEGLHALGIECRILATHILPLLPTPPSDDNNMPLPEN